MISESLFYINGKRVIPYQTFCQTLIQTFAMIPVTVPRILSISFIFISFTYWYALIPISIGILLYSILSLILVMLYKRFKLDNCQWGEYTMEKIRIQILTSILMPCYVVNPQWNLLAYLSLLSSTILSLILACLIYFSHFHNKILNLEIINDLVLYRKICYTLIGCLVFGSLTTFLQVWWIRRKHQSFIFQYFYDNVEMVETMLKSKAK